MKREIVECAKQYYGANQSGCYSKIILSFFI